MGSYFLRTDRTDNENKAYACYSFELRDFISIFLVHFFENSMEISYMWSLSSFLPLSKEHF